ncbi:hypothetical protein BDZ85DRAFT_111419 [Elsinoe ampelina]|uniref:Uncharacterized protein n=1 Tax=Elsinoe ampelina TaxID=302913 RepID=A0A6A6GDU0_9PEZI|nr:hypothetical protein BDZ85DRAFT_111419 [Elsinoe ampelina]
MIHSAAGDVVSQCKQDVAATGRELTAGCRLFRRPRNFIVGTDARPVFGASMPQGKIPTVLHWIDFLQIEALIALSFQRPQFCVWRDPLATSQREPTPRKINERRGTRWRGSTSFPSHSLCTGPCPPSVCGWPIEVKTYLPVTLRWRWNIHKL